MTGSGSFIRWIWWRYNGRNWYTWQRRIIGRGGSRKRACCCQES